MIKNEQIQMIIEECDLHSERLMDASNLVKSYFPLTIAQLNTLSKEQVSYLDQLIFRFSKLQDTIGSRLFPLIVATIDENSEKMTVIDKLNRLEKAEILPSVKEWQEMRNLTHEYPRNPELVVKNLNASLAYVKNLLDYWNFLKDQLNNQ
jgi:hypothetical protein